MPGLQVESGKARAVERRVLRTWAGVKDELAESMRDATPATCGADMLVPW